MKINTGFLVFVSLSSIFFIFEPVAIAGLAPQKYTSAPPVTPFTHIEFDEIAPFHNDSTELDEQSNEWRNTMRACGRRLESAGVRAIYFVPGTFAGGDPFGVIEGLLKIFPEFSPELRDYLLEYTKYRIDEVFGNGGSYSDDYVRLFKEAIGGNISCRLIIREWSSENHHMARLRGSIRLLKRLYDDINAEGMREGDRILLIGHSHAGQLFALMTNYLAQYNDTIDLLDLAEENIEYSGDHRFNREEFSLFLRRIRKLKLDFVTFGTPPRYGWGLGDYEYNLLNIINHRGEGHSGGSVLELLDIKKFDFTLLNILDFLSKKYDEVRKLSGFLYTEDGDYVQQWGISGTDITALDRKDRELNLKLDKLLGEGRDSNKWLKNVQAGKRVPDYGKTILVDYGDAGDREGEPNCIGTLFGHGTYIRYNAMLFNTKLIVEELYPDSKQP